VIRGYTRAYRRELESDIWQMPPIYHRVWFYLRQTANWQTKKMPTTQIMGMYISPGMLITSYQQIAEGVAYRKHGVLKIPNKRTVMSIVDWLEGNGMIRRESNGMGTTIYINNWDTYQGVEDAKVTEDSREKVTLSAPRSKREVHTTKEYKEVKEVIKNIYSHWNSLGIVVHRKIEPHQRHINARLSDGYSPAELKEAMGNYAAILKSDDCFFSYRWGLSDFLRPANLDRFLSSANPHETFRKKQGGGNGSSPHDPVEAAMRREMEAAG
jgi:hypothetical protein